MEKSNWRVDKLHNLFVAVLAGLQGFKIMIFCHSGNKLIENDSTKRYFQSKRRSIQDHHGMLCELICLLSCEHDMTQLVSMIRNHPMTRMGHLQNLTLSRSASFRFFSHNIKDWIDQFGSLGVMPFGLKMSKVEIWVSHQNAHTSPFTTNRPKNLQGRIQRMFFLKFGTHAM